MHVLIDTSIARQIDINISIQTQLNVVFFSQNRRVRAQASLCVAHARGNMY